MSEYEPSATTCPECGGPRGDVFSVNAYGVRCWSCSDRSLCCDDEVRATTPPEDTEAAALWLREQMDARSEEPSHRFAPGVFGGPCLDCGASVPECVDRPTCRVRGLYAYGRSQGGGSDG